MKGSPVIMAAFFGWIHWITSIPDILPTQQLCRYLALLHGSEMYSSETGAKLPRIKGWVAGTPSGLSSDLPIAPGDVSKVLLFPYY